MFVPKLYRDETTGRRFCAICAGRLIVYGTSARLRIVPPDNVPEFVGCDGCGLLFLRCDEGYAALARMHGYD